MEIISGDRKKLIDKIAKLLALADSSDFSEEAATAKNLAAELLAKHHVAIAELQAEPYETDSQESARFVAHDVKLFSALAKINGCVLYMAPERSFTRDGCEPGFIRSCSEKKRYLFVGKPSDIEAFRYMREIVIAQREVALQSYCLKTGRVTAINGGSALPMALQALFTIFCGPRTKSKKVGDLCRSFHICSPPAGTNKDTRSVMARVGAAKPTRMASRQAKASP